MHFSDSLAMARAVLFSKIVLLLAAIIAFATGAFASSPLAARRSDPPIVGPAPSAPAWGRRSDSTDRRSQHRHRGFQRRAPSQVFVVPSPYSYYYQYYSPYYFAARPALVNAPFFCFEHGVGFISRVGMIDHLGGTHKFLLEDAATICPENVETCVFEGVWPLY
jgi:hypothetical protein